MFDYVIHMNESHHVSSVVDAAKLQRFETVHLLLLETNGGCVNDYDEKGRTILHFAVIEKNHEMVALAIQFGVDSYIQDYSGMNALHLAAGGGDIWLVEKLLRYEVTAFKKNKDGETALHIACAHGHQHVVASLIQFHADVSTQDVLGRSALHIAAKYNNFAIIHMLINSGADVSAKDRGGSTVLHYIVRATTCSSCNSDGERIYTLQTQIDSEGEAFECVKDLCENGAMPDVCAFDNRNRCPIYFAAEGSVIQSYLREACLTHLEALVVELGQWGLEDDLLPRMEDSVSPIREDYGEAILFDNTEDPVPPLDETSDSMDFLDSLDFTRPSSPAVSTRVDSPSPDLTYSMQPNALTPFTPAFSQGLSYDSRSPSVDWNSAL